MDRVKSTLTTLWVALWVTMPAYAGTVSQKTVQSWIDGYVGFEKNDGQVSDFEGNPVGDVLFRAKLPGYGIFITNQGVHYVLYQVKSSDASPNSEILPMAPRDKELQESKLHYARIDLNLLGARIDPEKIEYEDPLPGYTNYYLPSHPDGILGVKTYRRVRIKDVYPGVDWVWRIEGGKVHHEFFVKAGADVSRIKLKVKWADVKLEEGGMKLVLSTPLGDVEDGEVTVKGDEGVEAAYKLEGGVLSYELRGWDGERDIVIDPPLSLAWATYYGGNGWDEGHSITTDASGNVFVTGYTSSTDFPTYNPGGGAYFDGALNGAGAFILKFEGPVSVSEDNGSITHPFQAPLFFQKAITLQFPSESPEPLRLVLSDATGRAILVKTYPATPSALLLQDRVISELPTGLYFLSLKVGKTNLGQVKLIKR